MSPPLPFSLSSLLCAALIGAFVVIGFAFRWRYLTTISLYVDEFTTMWAAERILEYGVPIMPSGVLYTRGILASYVEAAVMGMFGSNAFVARLPSLVFGLATVVAIFAIGRREWNWRVGLLAAAGLTLLPEAIVWSGRARFYAQLQLFVLLAAWAGYVSIVEDEHEARRQWGFAGLFTLALFSQEQTVLLYPSIVLAVLLWRGPRFFMRPAVLGAHLACLLALGLRYGIEIVGQPGYFETIQAERPYVGFVFDVVGAWNAYAGLLVAPERLPWTVFALVAIGAGLVALFRLDVRRLRDLPRFQQATLFFAVQYAFIFVVMLLFVGRTWRAPRYLFITQPFWLLVGAAGAIWLLERIVRTPRRQGVAAAALVVLALLTLWPAARETVSAQVEGYDLALSYVAEQRRPDDVVLSPQPPACALVLGPCDYYAVQRGYEEYVIRRDGRLIDRWSGASLLNTVEQLQTVIRDAPRVWFVTDSLRLASRYERDFVHTVIAQFDVVYEERGVLVLRADGWRERSAPAAGADPSPPATFDPLALVRWERSDAEAGAPLTVTGYWQGTAPIGEQINTFVRLLAQDGSRVAGDDGPPARGMIPTVLFGEMPLPDPKTLSLPADLPTGYYRLETGAYRLDSVTPLGDPVALDWLRIGPPPAPPERPLDAGWQNEMRLIGHDTLPARVQPGQDVTLRLVWSADAPVQEDYTIFVHLVPTGETMPVAQVDRAPIAGFYPTSAWDVEEFVADTYTLTVPADAPAGNYRLFVGLYRPETGTRAQLADGGDTVDLGTIEVVP